MTIPQVSASQQVGSTVPVGSTNNRQSTAQPFVSMIIADTDVQKETAKRINYATGKLESYKGLLKDPNIKPDQKAKLEAKIARLEKVYANTTAEIQPDGSVKFKFKEQVNAADFREAFGLKEGSLRPFLKAKHEAYLKQYDERVENPLTTLYDEKGTKKAELVNDGSNEEYFYAHEGSVLEYMDGFSKLSKKGGGLFGQGTEIPQYDGMILGPDDNIGFIQANRFKKP